MLTLETKLGDAIQALASASTVVDVTAIVRVAARALTDADGVTFVLREGDQVYYADENAIGPLWKGRRFPMSACVSGWVIARGTAVAIPDVYADARVPQQAYRPTFVRSMAMVPVRTGDTIAAIGAYWASRHEATAQELRILEVLAEASGRALARLS